jgi:cytochrome c
MLDYDRYLAFPARTTMAIQVKVLDSDWWWTIGLNGFELYNATATNPTDQFLSTTLNENWSWVRPYAVWNLYDHLGFLRMATDGHDLYGSGGGVQSILLRPPMSTGDWTATTRLEFSPTTNYQQAGLILYADDDNYIKLVFGYDDGIGGTGVEFAVESNAAFYAIPKIAVYRNDIYLRLEKRDQVCIGSWSEDNSNWHYINQFNPPANPRIGLIAQSTQGALADFDWFNLTSP